jgi:hypothetical protein
MHNNEEPKEEELSAFSLLFKPSYSKMKIISLPHEVIM